VINVIMRNTNVYKDQKKPRSVRNGKTLSWICSIRRKFLKFVRNLRSIMYFNILLHIARDAKNIRQNGCRQTAEDLYKPAG